MPIHDEPFRRRNLIRDTHWAGAVAGTPGVLPKDFLLISDPPLADAGVTASVVGVTAEAGMRRLDLRFVGSATPLGNIALCMTTLLNPLMLVRPGETLTHSCFARLVGAVSGVLPVLSLQFNEYSAAGIWQADHRADFVPALAAITPQRQRVTGRITQSATVRVLPILGIYFDAGQTFDFTLGLALPQLERAVRASAPQRRFF